MKSHVLPVVQGKLNKNTKAVSFPSHTLSTVLSKKSLIPQQSTAPHGHLGSIVCVLKNATQEG